jgi:hypothetical protein
MTGRSKRAVYVNSSVTVDVSGRFGVKCDDNVMSTTETPKEVVYCNNCGTANP